MFFKTNLKTNDFAVPKHFVIKAFDCTYNFVNLTLAQACFSPASEIPSACNVTNYNLRKHATGKCVGWWEGNGNKQNGSVHARGRGACEVISGQLVNTARTAACAANIKKREHGAWNLGKKGAGEEA